MKSFWNGFEKRGRGKTTTEDPKQNLKDTISTVGGTTAANLLATGGAAGIGMLDKKMTPDEVENYKSHMSKRYGTNVQTNNTAPHDLFSAYHPDINTIRHAKNPRRGVFAHEMGHASGLNSKTMRGRLTTGMYRSSLGMAAGMAASPLMALHNNKYTEAAAPYAGAAAMSPILYEEGRASLNALKNIKHLHGNKAMLRSVPGLLGAFGTYASLPLVSGLMTKHYINKRKELQRGK